MKSSVSIDNLKSTCDPEVLGCTSSMDVAPLQTIIGQVKALRALQFGLDIKEKGFNIYVSGLPGTGKKTAVRRYLGEITRDKPTPPDWCYVNNFQDNYRPRALSLPAGRARNLKKEVDIFVEAARSEIRKAFESEEYAVKRNNAIKAIQQQREQLVNKTNEQAQKQGFIIQATPMGLVTIPIKDNKPLTEEEFLLLEKKERDSITRKQQRLNERLKKAGRQMISIEKKTVKVIDDLDRHIASNTLDLLLDDLREEFHDIADVLTFLAEMQDDMLDNLALFRQDEHGQEKPMGMPQGEDMRYRKYRVNVLVDNSDMEGVPIVLELNPTYNNLFGRIEKEAMMGALFTDFTMIREGSVHRANGGYLILPVEDVLRNILSWDSLKRSIRNKEILIEEAGERLGFMTTRGLMPEPIPWNIKVILIGDPYLYYRLY
ncbi:MAG TPA: ATP-binding protein, partial [Deltaproteobacteria bacterium]|nr:ATP-binding protein [Deltaproteobacteria bacterium]